MTLVSFYNPLASRRTGVDFERVFESFVKSASEMANARLSYPAVNIYEEPERFRLEVAAPGYQKDDFKVSIDNDMLKISAEKENNPVEGEAYTRCEFLTGSFERTFVVGKAIDTNKIDARYENGILTVFLSKRDEAKPQKPRSIKID
ncbi:MAG: Hsp20/alpha crystallin family protein [Tenuifilum sp.]|uniref:Hsp20/alpha crystallin family protein n=1 Tax=Tenuifilum sp. TaxID=2760880 RepID=UPI001B40D4E1|nr:Hsp20/alpha crystallin family protein [Bacteroidales bacterium]HOK60937.1 Hsp20/alpha crystallin family protein [Tenuifilum sp.]MBP9028534.1 Hsp20/alpha crystallin family protein [Bacteroidales bacterium]HOK86868.1 Hsp20/alpha crystallin family protein [Tenuifilum sp.]HON69673.1 Hsp20/alpha crystallin family protein [Tenuifilum sp.]